MKEVKQNMFKDIRVVEDPDCPEGEMWMVSGEEWEMLYTDNIMKVLIVPRQRVGIFKAT